MCSYFIGYFIPLGGIKRSDPSMGFHLSLCLFYILHWKIFFYLCAVNRPFFTGNKSSPLGDILFIMNEANCPERERKGGGSERERKGEGGKEGRDEDEGKGEGEGERYGQCGTFSTLSTSFDGSIGVDG